MDTVTYNLFVDLERKIEQAKATLSRTIDAFGDECSGKEVAFKTGRMKRSAIGVISHVTQSYTGRVTVHLENKVTGQSRKINLADIVLIGKG